MRLHFIKSLKGPCILVSGVICHHFSLFQELYFSIPKCHETAVWCAKIVQSRTLSRSSKRSVSGFLGLGWQLISKSLSWFVLHVKHQSGLQSAVIMSERDSAPSERRGVHCFSWNTSYWGRRKIANIFNKRNMKFV